MWQGQTRLGTPKCSKNGQSEGWYCKRLQFAYWRRLPQEASFFKNTLRWWLGRVLRTCGQDTFSRNTRLQLKQLLDAVRELMAPPDPPKRPIGFVTPEEGKKEKPAGKKR